MKSANSIWSIVGLGAAMLLAAAATPQQPESHVQGTGVAKVAATQQAKSSGTITVHGKWTVTVRNADGSVVAQHRFNNALTANGAQFFAESLTGWPADPQLWRVRLDSSTGNAPCVDATGARGTCVLGESLDAFLPPGAGTLVVNRAVPGVLLLGTIKSTFAGDITDVRTSFRTISPQSAITTLTHKTLPQPISVNAGQFIDVSVSIDF